MSVWGEEVVWVAEVSRGQLALGNICIKVAFGLQDKGSSAQPRTMWRAELQTTASRTDRVSRFPPFFILTRCHLR